MSNLLSYQRLKYLRMAEGVYSKRMSSNLNKSSQPSPKSTDMIGPPDPVSNLRPVVFAKTQSETKVEKEYREARKATQEWNHKFWSEHNARFISERKEFQKKLKSEGKEAATADEMSVFYKNFLDKNWKSHINYNYSWYKQNLRILFLELKVRLSKMKFK